MNTAEFLDSLLRDCRDGWFVAVAIGQQPYRDGKGKYRHNAWREERFAWPARRDELLEAVGWAMNCGEPTDFYLCPVPRNTDARNGTGSGKGTNATPCSTLFADLDGEVAQDKLDTLDATAAASGTGDHLHVYVALDAPIPVARHRVLNKALAEYLGADAKWADNSLLRMPGTLNFKPTAPVQGERVGPAVPVEVVRVGGQLWSPDELEELLGLSTSGARPVSGSVYNADDTPDAEPVPEPLPDLVRRALDHSEVADKSVAHARVVGACVDSRLTLGQTITVCAGYVPSVEKYGDRLSAEVARCWGKFRTERPHTIGEGAGTTEDIPAPVNLPDEFWSARPVLEHIRAAAHSRNRSADAVLHAVLAREASLMPCGVRVDTGVGSPAVLNYFTVLAGPSSSGKSTSAAIARMVIPPLSPGFAVLSSDHDPYADDVPLGTGEGLAEAFMGTVTRENAKGRPVQVRAKVRSNAFVYGDEGEALVKLLERGGATIGEALRRAWIGGTIGQRNGTDERTRIVPAGTYSLGVVIGFQPETIGPLLDDASAGTPQRFTFCSAVDPSIPETAPEWPGELRLTYPAPVGPVGVSGAIQLDVAPAIRAEIRSIDYAKATGRTVPPPLDGHEQLTRIKVAALLAILDGRASITVEDWGLSGTVWRTSCAVRDALIAGHRREAVEREQLATKRQVARHTAVQESEDERVLFSACRSVGRRLHTHAPTHPEGSCPRRCVNQAMASKHKGVVTVDQVIERLLDSGVLERVDGDRLRAGRVQP